MKHFMVNNVTTGNLEDMGVTQGKIGNDGSCRWVLNPVIGLS